MGKIQRERGRERERGPSHDRKIVAASIYPRHTLTNVRLIEQLTIERIDNTLCGFPFLHFPFLPFLSFPFLLLLGCRRYVGTASEVFTTARDVVRAERLQVPLRLIGIRMATFEHEILGQELRGCAGGAPGVSPMCCGESLRGSVRYGEKAPSAQIYGE